MKTLLLILCAMGLLVGSLNAVVIFSDDFSGDLSQWYSGYSGYTLGSINTNKNLQQIPPCAAPYECIAISQASFTDSGNYSLSFDVYQDYRWYNYYVWVRIPGGIKMTFGGWNNDGQILYKGTYISDVANGCFATWTNFQIKLTGQNLQIFKDSTSIYSTTLATAPDFTNYNKVELASHAESLTPVLWDDIELTGPMPGTPYSPDMNNDSLINLADYDLFILNWNNSYTTQPTVVFQDNFETNLNQWYTSTSGNATIDLVAGETSGQCVQLTQGVNYASISSVTTFTQPGLYHLSFDMYYDIRHWYSNSGTSTQMAMPGGLQVGQKGWDNGLSVFYLGDRIYDFSMQYGHICQWRHYDLYQRGHDIAVKIDGVVVYTEKVIAPNYDDFQHAVFAATIDESTGMMKIDNVKLEFLAEANYLGDFDGDSCVNNTDLQILYDKWLSYDYAIVPAFGESALLAGTSPSRLAHSQIVQGSLIVRDTYAIGGAMTVYEEGVDYTVNYTNGTISRTAGSSIPNYADNDNYGFIDFASYDENTSYFVWCDYEANDNAAFFTNTNQSRKLARTYALLSSGEPVKIVFFGDSITAGGNASLFSRRFANRFVEYLRNEYPQATVTFENNATGGDTAAMGLNRLQDKVLSRDPDLVLIGFGMNDHSGVSVSAFQSTLTTIVNSIYTNTDAEVLLYSSCPAHEDWLYSAGQAQMALFAAATENVANATGTAYANVNAAFVNLLNRKNYGTSMSGTILDNNANHPNDFGHWIYTQALESVDFVPALDEDFDNGTSNWTLTKTSVATAGTVQISGSDYALQLTAPDGQAYATSNAGYSSGSIYELTYSMKYHLYDYNDGRFRVVMPGGLEVALKSWFNGTIIRYKDTVIADLSGGHFDAWAHYELYQNGRYVSVKRDGVSLYSGTMTSDPDYTNYGHVKLYMGTDNGSSYMQFNNLILHVNSN